MKNHFENLKKLKAFTLIEMLLVLLIISVLVKMINSQIEAYTLKHNRTPSNINDLINDGLIKEGQKQCRSGETITISNGEAIAN